MLRFRRALFSCLGVALVLTLLSCSRHDAELAPVDPTNAPLHPTLPPDRTITSSAVTPDGAIWYSYDLFDDIGGSPQGAQNGELRCLQGGRLSRHRMEGTIRAIEVGPDGGLYIAAGCGLARIRNGEWETLAEVDCAQSTFSGPMVAFDIAFAPDGAIWLAGVHNLARCDGEGWTEYGVNARRLLVSPDGSLWAEGWDGRAGSDCCFVHVRGSEAITYLHTAALPVPATLLPEIRGLLAH
jgi:hypothetical protein